MGRALGNIAGAVAPIAAGYFGGPAGLFGLGATGSAIAAGALTGAGIAGLRGDDMLMGAVGGGLGGYGGGAMAGANTAAKEAAQGTLTDAAFNKTIQNQAMQQAGAGINSGITGTTGELGANMGQTISQSGRAFPNIGTTGASQGATIGQSYRPDFMATATKNVNVPTAQFGKDYGFSDVARELGGGDVTKGYMKAGITGLPVVASALEPEYETFEDVMSEDVYDPNSQLNLNMDTGIREAMQKDSGLRLYAEGGGVIGVSSSPGLPIAGATMGGGMAESVSETMAAPGGFDTFESMVASGIDPANAAAMFGMDTDPYLDTGPGMTYTSPPRTSPIRGGISELPPPPSMFTPTPEFDDEYTGGYMTPSRMKSVGMEPGYSGRTRRYERLPMATGGYLNGGTLKGDGMSDDVPAMIDGTQKAALSQGEFVIPADVVSHLGNGSSDAGSKQLYGMMDKIRKARTGTKKQGKEINPERFMPS